MTDEKLKTRRPSVPDVDPDKEKKPLELPEDTADPQSEQIWHCHLYEDTGCFVDAIVGRGQIHANLIDSKRAHLVEQYGDGEDMRAIKLMVFVGKAIAKLLPQGTNITLCHSNDFINSNEGRVLAFQAVEHNAKGYNIDISYIEPERNMAIAMIKENQTPKGATIQ